MKIQRFCIVLSLCAVVTGAVAQSEEKSEKAVKAVINRFFEGMEKGDTSLIRGACTDDPVLQTYMADKAGNMLMYTENFSDFLTIVGSPAKDKYKEVIEFDGVHVEKSLASVWTPYVFYVNGKVAHCGTNSFQMVKTDAGWKIQYIIDTRRKQGCK